MAIDSDWMASDCLVCNEDSLALSSDRLASTIAPRLVCTDAFSLSVKSASPCSWTVPAPSAVKVAPMAVMASFTAVIAAAVPAAVPSATVASVVTLRPALVEAVVVVFAVEVPQHLVTI